MDGKEITKITDRLRTLCSRREYCRSEMMKKALSYPDMDKETAEKIVETLVSEKYVDDLRYASAFARDKSSISGWGNVKISYMLSSKGIPKEIVREAVGEIDESRASDKLRRVMETKAKSLKGDPQIRLKLLRFALGRGYGYEEVNKMLELILKDNG